jgi:hypothetical protein
VTTHAGTILRSPNTEREMLERYHRDGDFAARTEFIERTMAVVHHFARRYADRGETPLWCRPCRSAPGGRRPLRRFRDRERGEATGRAKETASAGTRRAVMSGSQETTQVR